MAREQMNVESEQAEIMWRALWAEVAQIDEAFANRLTMERDAHNAWLNTISLLRQINVRFHIVKDSTFDGMVDEARLPERKFA